MLFIELPAIINPVAQTILKGQIFSPRLIRSGEAASHHGSDAERTLRHCVKKLAPAGVVEPVEFEFEVRANAHVLPELDDCVFRLFRVAIFFEDNQGDGDAAPESVVRCLAQRLAQHQNRTTLLEQGRSLDFTVQNGFSWWSRGDSNP